MGVRRGPGRGRRAAGGRPGGVRPAAVDPHVVLQHDRSAAESPSTASGPRTLSPSRCGSPPRSRSPATPADLRAMAGVLLRKVLSPTPSSDASATRHAAGAALAAALPRRAVRAQGAPPLRAPVRSPEAHREEDEDAGEGNNYGVAQECLDRLAIAIGGNAIVMLKNLEQVVSMILNGFQHPHPRVRWAAINAIGQLSTDLGPDLQVHYHQKVLPALANAMDDFQNPRVQAHAASAILNFSENCTPEILTPYLDGIVNKLLVLLQNGKQMVQEGALTALASVADSSQCAYRLIETITLGDKRIGIRTSVLEEKATACNMLCCYADELKEAMPELMRSAKLAVEKGQAQGRDESYVKQLSDYIIPALVEALHKEPETEMCSSMLDSLNECMQLSGRLLDEAQVRAISDEIKNVIIASATRKRERTERTKAEDFDADEGELLKEENEQEEEVFDQVSECLGTLIKTFKASFLPFFDELSVYITPMLGKDKTPEERRIAICIFDDVAEQCREAALRYYDTYLPFLLEAANDENSDVRQAAVYGVGVVPAWLNCLPIKDDKIEAKVVHEQLCSMVERLDAEILGPNNQYLFKIVSIFVEVLGSGTELATDETRNKMVNILRRFQQTLPPDFLASTFSNLQPQQQLLLQSILST
ncbi:hypothetical protein HU200_054767 [Digitaria exilis]|uniref:Uncharacterized protein n=1 Tax=Digitaria exilis TaxID=1010633 RepID=A0A835E6V9_9POAL|nr:hypothetical protein HU200_054767 [Digitaria exilis]